MEGDTKITRKISRKLSAKCLYCHVVLMLDLKRVCFCLPDRAEIIKAVKLVKEETDFHVWSCRR